MQTKFSQDRASAQVSGRRLRMFLSAVLGATVFGAWAFVANVDAPERRLGSAMAQGIFSFLFSLVAMSVTEGTYAALRNRRFQIPIAIAAPTLLSGACAVLVHATARTPAIAMTVAGPVLVGAVYQGMYVMALRRLDRQRPRRPN